MDGYSKDVKSRGSKLPGLRGTSTPIFSNNTNLTKAAKRYPSTSSVALFGTVTWFLILILSSFLSFYFGVWTGIKAASDHGCLPKIGSHNVLERDGDNHEHETNAGCTTSCLAETMKENGEFRRRVEVLAQQKVKQEMQNKLEDLCKNLPSTASKSAAKSNSGDSRLFSRSISHFATGLVRVGKDDLMRTFDFGVPPTPNTQDKDALILYNKKEALPSDKNIAKAAQYESSSNQKELPFLSAAAATENCETMNVVLINNPGNTKQCMALVGGQYQSYHIQRWMRRDTHGGLKPEFPLKMSSRGLTTGGRDEFVPPRDMYAKEHQDFLRTYLNNVEDIKNRLKPIIQKIAVAHTVIVLTCNMGQSELLMNFVCSARARGFDLKNVLVFPTDIETKKLAEGMGLTTFYEELLMASIPKTEAKYYGDKIFTRVMLAKVMCVQLVNEIGFDLLFQDVDLVWYQNPLDYFHDKSLAEFDIYFQDDGSRQERYAPYSANSGFYYVRSNERTRFLFRSLLYSGDLITTWYSHQQVLITLLSEYNSLMALRVKILSKEMEEFPGGVQYHRNKEALKKIMSGESNAIIFHMSWTNNKDNKVLFFKQMGEWYLQDKCIGQELENIPGVGGSSPKANGILLESCCAPEPLISCHFRDKPSKFPCPDSPNIDEKGKSFW